MTFLSGLFSSTANPVLLSYPEVKRTLWDQTETEDRDFTDYIFRTLGIGRVHHPVATTWRYLTDPGRTLSLAAANSLETPGRFFASSGLFTTAYKTWGMKDALAMLLRDDIPELRYTSPKTHVVTGLKGIRLNRDFFQVTGLLTGYLGKKGRITGIGTLPVTQENAEMILDFTALCLRRMKETGTLDLTACRDEFRSLNPAGRREQVRLLAAFP